MRIWPISFVQEQAEVNWFEHWAICIISAYWAEDAPLGRIDACHIENSLASVWSPSKGQKGQSHVLKAWVQGYGAREQDEVARPMPEMLSEWLPEWYRLAHRVAYSVTGQCWRLCRGPGACMKVIWAELYFFPPFAEHIEGFNCILGKPRNHFFLLIIQIIILDCCLSLGVASHCT